jgi:hypothetical protein
MGIQLSRTFTTDGSDDAWGAAVGFADPLDDASTVMFVYSQDAAPDLTLGEGWFEVGFTREHLFGSEHLVLLSSLGRSTQGNSSALLGVQVAL